MTYLVNELKVIPGVLGACFYNVDQGVKAVNLPTVFKKERLELIGGHLHKMYAAGMATFDRVDGLCLHFDESVIVARAFPPDTLCFVVCDAACNLNVLALSLRMMEEEVGRCLLMGG